MSDTDTMPTFDDPRLFINRELSLVHFFRRVLAMAGQSETPVMERLRFLTICSTITDEFFEIRVAGLKQRAQYGIERPGPDGLRPSEVLRHVNELVREMVLEQYRLLTAEVLPALELVNVHILKRNQWSDDQRQWIRTYFKEQVAPVLTPVGLDPAHPFPRVQNKSLNMFVVLEGKDAFGRKINAAVLPVPRCLPRVIRVPSEGDADRDDFVLLSSVIHAHVGKSFPGMKVIDCHQFRVTRNADLAFEEEGVEDLLDALKGQLPGRRYGDAVRLEVAMNCPQNHIEFLLDQFKLKSHDVYKVDGPVNLMRLQALYDEVGRADLQFPAFVQGVAVSSGDMFEIISQGDILLHHPYESFTPVVDLLRQAADDPAVLAIKQTVYRTGTGSPIVEALIDAARMGKEVTAVVELRARFDEAANINLATQLQEAGAHVVYGVVGYKTHSKMLMVVRREGTRLKRYVHLGTGNYHASTARVYTDFGLMTCDAEIGEDVHNLFMQLTGLGRAKRLNRLLQAPFTLQPSLLRHIEEEIDEAKAGRPARIVAKMNSISDPIMIRALYRASTAGVEIDLIIRGVCCLRPGVPGVSENIRVRSVVGRFLEHTRIYCFHAAGKETTYLASADWMRRNLYRRVEACFPMDNPSLKKRVLKEGLRKYLDDTCGAWEMQSDGTYTKLEPEEGQRVFSAQLSLLDLLADR